MPASSTSGSPSRVIYVSEGHGECYGVGVESSLGQCCGDCSLLRMVTVGTKGEAGHSALPWGKKWVWSWRVTQNLRPGHIHVAWPSP